MKTAKRAVTLRSSGIGLLTGVFLLAIPLLAQQGQRPLNRDLASNIDKLFTTAVKSETSDQTLDARVGQIFADHGIPTDEMVGEECVEKYVFLISSQPTAFVETVMPALKRAADAGKVSENSYIYLSVQMRQKKIREKFSGAPANPALADEIKRLWKTDQAVRPANGKRWDLKKLEATDRADGVTARRIVAKYGLPTFSLVGPEAARDFDDVVQHQPLTFQKQVLPQMEVEAKAGEVSSEAYAMLYDRVESYSHRPQTYGENFVCTPDGGMKPSPIADEKDVDRRRAELGLMPLSLYSKVVGDLYMKNLCAQVAAANRKTAPDKTAVPHQ